MFLWVLMLQAVLRVDTIVALMNFRKVVFTEGNAGYSTTTVCHGFQHSGHQRSSSAVFNGEWILQSESNKARMVPKLNKVGNQTEVCETVNHRVPGNFSAWREEANKVRERNGQIARNVDDSSYFNGSVPIIPDASSYETSQKLDYGFEPRGNSTTTTINKESLGVTQSGPVVPLPSKDLEVGTNVDVNLKGDGKQKPLINGKSSVSASNENKVTISKAEKCTEPSKVRANLSKIFDKVLIVDNVSAAKNAVAMLVNQYRNLVHSCDTEVSFIFLSKLSSPQLRNTCTIGNLNFVVMLLLLCDYSMLIGVQD